MPRATQVLAQRFGRIGVHELFVNASIVAAHGMAGRTTGFRASDVRFFFQLFTNWLEHDVLRPGQDLELTQIRRALAKLVQARYARVVASASDRGVRARGATFALTPQGLAKLVEAVVDTTQRRAFDETLFIVCFAASYGPAIVARVEGETAPLTAAMSRRVGELLEPQRILRAALGTVDTLLADVDERVRSGRELARRVDQDRARGRSDGEIVKRLEQLGAYQLHHVRTFSELMKSLPADLAKFEIHTGISLRVQTIFEPFAAQVRSQRAVLEKLARSLAK